MRLVFAGTPAFAATALEALIAAGHDVVLVLAQPDRPSGRGMQVQPGPVRRVADAHGIAVAQPQGLKVGGRFDADARTTLERLRTTPHDAMIVAAYGLIIPPAILAIAPHGCINIHASLLPRWRGAAPVQRAIEAGDTETGITIMQMDEGLDTGPMLAVSKVPIGPDETGGSLTERLAVVGGEAIVDALPKIADGRLAPLPQHPPGDASHVTYAAKLAKHESRLDFAAPSRALVDRIRAFDPWPGAAATLDDTTWKVWKAAIAQADAGVEPGTLLRVDERGPVVATGDGAIVLVELQRPGGRRQIGRAFAADLSASVGRRFASSSP